MNVPLVDLQAQYASIEVDVDLALKKVLSSGEYIGGQEVDRFENQFAQQHGVDHCISTANGSDAIYLALIALGIAPGDEVIVPAMSWISTATMVTHAGATPIFVDVDQRVYTISVEAVEAAITSKTKAIVAVHLYGQMADVNALRSICDQRGLYLIEDAAQAHIANVNGIMPGHIGDAATFSFYPTKNLGAYGDAGAVLTKNDELARKIRNLANYGLTKGQDVERQGTNSRLDSLQAAILSVKLKYLDVWTGRKTDIARKYNELLTGISGLVTPTVREGARHVYYTYVIECDHRDELMDYLNKNGVTTKFHYPHLLSALSLYRKNKANTQPLLIAKAAQKRILSLPIYAELTEEQVEYVCQKIHDFYSN